MISKLIVHLSMPPVKQNKSECVPRMKRQETGSDEQRPTKRPKSEPYNGIKEQYIISAGMSPQSP